MSKSFYQSHCDYCAFQECDQEIQLKYSEVPTLGSQQQLFVITAYTCSCSDECSLINSGKDCTVLATARNPLTADGSF